MTEIGVMLPQARNAKGCQQQQKLEGRHRMHFPGGHIDILTLDFWSPELGESLYMSIVFSHQFMVETLQL